MILGQQDDLVKAIHILKEDGPPRRLYLAPQKSTVWCGKHLKVNEDPLHCGIPRAEEACFELLGAPVGDSTFSVQILDKRINKIRILIQKKLPNLQDSQAEFVLCSCFSLPKLEYFIRNSMPPPLPNSTAYYVTPSAPS